MENIKPEGSIYQILNRKQESKRTIILELIKELPKEFHDQITYIENITNLIKLKKIELPILPIIATKVLELSYSPKAEFRNYADLVKSDTVIALKVIQLANSPLYRGLRDVTDLEIAIGRIGLEGLKEIVIMLSVKMKIFNNKEIKEKVEESWKFSLLTAILASQIAKEFKIPSSKLYTIGLLHDVGNIIFYDTINRNKLLLKKDIASRVYFSYHSKLSALALQSWKFPKEQVLMVKDHHLPPKDKDPIDNKIFYLSHSTISAIETIKNDYSKDTLFPYQFLIKHSKIELDPKQLFDFVNKSFEEYETIMEIL